MFNLDLHTTGDPPKDRQAENGTVVQRERKEEGWLQGLQAEPSLWNNADHNALSNLLSTVLDRARARKVRPVRRPQNCPFVASSTPTSTLDPQKPLAAPALVERDLLFPSSRPCDKRTIVTDSCRRFDF